ncbi:hypothetical protein D0867_00400 [Hortaea werneckii]|uniref:BZIP domain-containing protein n=1 Tax=Hortaea werneckii TaxID=91943 RepID=A0A3M6ZMI9_HORWE|nr:hypothetical protein D0868_00370 [Hortaea werneckii]RMY25927.1 hypothetical protein D0867_00400 [Hortaea werneckii]
MAGKKAAGENSKKAAGNAKKAEVAAGKKANENAKAEAAEAEQWKKGAKDNSKADAAAAKQAEAAKKKAEKDALMKEEEASLPTKGGKGKAPPAKKSKGLDLSGLDAPSSKKDMAALNATGIDNALDALSLTKESNEKIDRHPERRFPAAYKAYEERRLEEMKEEKGLRRQQKIDQIRKEFDKHPDNPFNQVSGTYNMSKEEMNELRESERAKKEAMLTANADYGGVCMLINLQELLLAALCNERAQAEESALRDYVTYFPLSITVCVVENARLTSMRVRRFEFIDSRAPDKQQRRIQFLARSHAARVSQDRSRIRSGKQGRKNSYNGEHIPNERDNGAQPQGRPHVNRAKRFTQPNMILHLDPVPRAVSPIFGALTMTLPSWQPHSEDAESLHYYLNFFAPQVMLPKDANDRFLACSQYPVIFHSLQYAALLHREILRSGDYRRTENRQMLLHKVKTIGLLRDLISTLEDRMINVAVHAILHLLWEQASIDGASDDEEQVLLFVPHLPSACWVNVYGKARGVSPHFRALKTLIQRAGGLDRIAPDLVRQLRVFDLIMASAACIRPAFPYSARVDEGGVLDLLATHFGMGTFPSFGFSLQLRHALPSATLEVYDRMCMLDVLLPFCQSLRRGDAAYDVLLMARSGFYHRLLSLPPWDELPESEKCHLGSQFKFSKMSMAMANDLEMKSFLNSLGDFDEQANIDHIFSRTESSVSSPSPIDVQSLPAFDAAFWSSPSLITSRQQQEDESTPMAGRVSAIPMRMKSGSSKVARRKEQNRFAQRAFRDRQRRLISELQAEINASYEKNNELTAKNQQLEQRMQELQCEMMLHFATVHGANELLSTNRQGGKA